LIIVDGGVDGRHLPSAERVEQLLADLIDREKAGFYGITLDQIRNEWFDAFGARQVATIYTATNDYQVILECQPQFQTDPSQLQNIFVKTNVPGPGAAGEPLRPPV